MGATQEPGKNADTLHTSPQDIQARIDALLIAWQYAGPEQKQSIQARIDALQIALTYA